MNTTHTIAKDERSKISVKNLDFYYGKFHALKGINLEIPEKKVTAFIGPSGCGKSTLLRVFNRMFELYPEQRAVGEIVLSLRRGLGRRLFVRMGHRNRQAKHKKKVTRHGCSPAESATDYASARR